MTRLTAEEVIERYCNLRHHVLVNVFENGLAVADCFCHRRNPASEFYDYGAVDLFIRAAVLEKIAEVKGRRRMGRLQRAASRRLP